MHMHVLYVHVCFLCCCVVLQAKHVSGGEGCERWGVDGNTGVLTDMQELGVWEPLAVKEQTFKTAIEVLQVQWVHIGGWVCVCVCVCVCDVVHVWMVFL